MNFDEFKDLLDTFAPVKRKKIDKDNWWYLFKLAHKYDFPYIYTRCKNIVIINKSIIPSNDQIEYMININDYEFAEFACKRLVWSEQEIDFENIRNDRMRIYVMKYLDAKRRSYKGMIVNMINIVKKTYLDTRVRDDLKEVLKSEAIEISL